MISRYIMYLRGRVRLSAATTILRLILLTLCLLTTGWHVAAQEDSAAPADEVVRVRTDLITVPVFVTDSHERRITHLTQNDFAVRDNGQAVEVSYFAAGQQPIALLFALDASGSARDTITRQREAASALFSRFGPGSRVAVLHFSDQAQLAARFTVDADQVRQAFHFAPLRNRRTAIFDAALSAVRAYDEKKPSSIAERRIVVLLSDGLDTASTTRASAVIDEAVARGVSIYVVHLPLFMPRDNRLVPRPPSKGFREMAKATGGRYFLAGDAQTALDPQAEHDLSPIFQAIAEDIQGQYLLGYYPTNGMRDNRFHRIQVNLSRPANRKLRVHTLREGYTLNSAEY